MSTAAGYDQPRLPVVVTPAWLAAVESAGWQCTCSTTAPGQTPGPCGNSHRKQPDRRCNRRGTGPVAVRLILTDDGQVYCEQCAEGREKTQRRAKRNDPPPAEFEQGDLLAALL